MARPFVFINMAVTADGKTDTFERRGAAISSREDKERVDALRAGADAVMVGGRTLLDEDPSLTVKSAERRAQRGRRGVPPNPMKVGIVTRPDIALQGRFMTAGPARVVIFTTLQASREQVAALRSHGAEVHILGDLKVDPIRALEILHELGVRRLMVEGGGTLNFELLRLGLVDELSLYVAPMLFGGVSAPTPAAGEGLGREEALLLDLVDVMRQEDGGVLLRYRPRTLE